jgi:hypothetical protein
MTPEGWNIRSTSILFFTVVKAHGYNSCNTKYIAVCITFDTCIGTKQRFIGSNLSGFLATTRQTERKEKGERRICVNDMQFGCLLDHIALWTVVIEIV